MTHPDLNSFLFHSHGCQKSPVEGFFFIVIVTVNINQNQETPPLQCLDPAASPPTKGLRFMTKYQPTSSNTSRAVLICRRKQTTSNRGLTLQRSLSSHRWKYFERSRLNICVCRKGKVSPARLNTKPSQTDFESSSSFFSRVPNPTLSKTTCLVSLSCGRTNQRRDVFGGAVSIWTHRASGWAAPHCSSI